MLGNANDGAGGSLQGTNRELGMCVDRGMDCLQLGWRAGMCPHTHLSVAVSQAPRIPATVSPGTHSEKFFLPASPRRDN